MSRKRILDAVVLALAAAIVGATVLFLIAPLLVSISMAFDARTFLGPFPPEELSLQWFRRFFASNYLISGLQVSLVLACLSSITSMAIGTLAAFGIARLQFVGSDLLLTLFMSPLLIPGVITGFGLLLFFSFFDLFNGFTKLLIGHVLITVPFCIRTALASLVGIRRSLTEAAMSLGANERRAFWDITFPLARTGILAGGIFAFAISMDDLAVSLFLADPRTHTLPIALVSTMRSNFDLTIAAASSVLLLVTALIVLLLGRFVGLGKLLGQGVYRP